MLSSTPVIRADRVIPAVLTQVIRKAPLTPEKVTFAWSAAVGPALQRVTSVRLDGDGVLHVTAINGHWAVEVKRASRVVLARLAAWLGPDVARSIRISSPKDHA